MKFIDMHVHIGDSLGIDLREEIVLKMMEKYDVEYCLVSNADSAEVDHDLKPIPQELQVSQKESFERSIRFARENPGKIGVLPWIKPRFERADDEFVDLIEKNRDIIKGIKIHPYHSNTYFDSEKVQEYIKIAEKYDLPFLIHTGGNDVDSVKRVYNMAVKYPKVRFVMAHMGLGTDNKEAVDLMGKADNLYGDTAWVPMETTIEVIKRYGSKRMMFGSDSPIDGFDTYTENGYGQRSLYQDYFNELESKIGKEAFEDLMYNNAVEFFKIYHRGQNTF